MIYEMFAPPPDLAPFVRFFWVYECDAGPNDEYVHRTLADCCTEIEFHYREHFDEITDGGIVKASPRANIRAQSTGFRRFVTQRSFGIFGAYLYAFAIPRLFGLSAAELTNLNPHLFDLIGSEAHNVYGRVVAAHSNTERATIVSEFLLSRLNALDRDLPTVHLAVRSVLNSDGSIPIEKLAAEHGLSRRHFERRFKELTGLSPKSFSRVARFQAATQFKLDGCRNLTEIACACGYYDQSHFINNFRELSGYTPKEYFSNTVEGMQYLDSEEMSQISRSERGF